MYRYFLLVQKLSTNCFILVTYVTPQQTPKPKREEKIYILF
jgi:hypothetical protein